MAIGQSETSFSGTHTHWLADRKDKPVPIKHLSDLTGLISFLPSMMAMKSAQKCLLALRSTQG
jgi:hypothetical protein